MRRIVLARTIKRTTILLLFLSILVLILNSFLPIVILKNPDNPAELVYFNIESMQYSDNSDIQNLYNEINLINAYIWLIIILIFIAFFGIIINISYIYEKISYLFLTIGCLSIIFSSISCYLYFIFILKVTKFDNILLAYISVEQLRYSYLILIILISTVVVSISYIITTLTLLFKTLKDAKSDKQELTKEKPITKSFSKHIEEGKNVNNKKQIVNENLDFKKKKELPESWFENEINITESAENAIDQDFKEDLNENYIKKETMDEQTNIDIKNVEHSDEKISPFLEDYKQEKTKQKNDKTSEVKISESFEKALYSAIDKKKKGETSQERIDKNNQKIVLKKEKSIKKYSVKCPECSFIFTQEKNEADITKIKCPRCGKAGVIK